VGAWLASRLHFSVLFQDTDVVWFRHPLEAEVFQDQGVDAFFMDDGSRAERFSPLFPTPGFFFLRANRRTRSFLQVGVQYPHLREMAAVLRVDCPTE
jgi:hypothetical protein